MTKNRGRVTRAMCYIDTLIQCYAVTRLEYGVYTRWLLVPCPPSWGPITGKSLTFTNLSTTTHI